MPPKVVNRLYQAHASPSRVASPHDLAMPSLRRRQAALGLWHARLHEIGAVALEDCRISEGIS
jgi:hypothetical protein